jgi:hypothetical protein
MDISPVANSPGIESQAVVQQTQTQNIQNQTSVNIEQNVSPDLTNQVECEQSVSEYLQEVSPEISPDELAIYEDAGLNVEQVGDRVCLTQPDIDLDYKDANGMTNLERMENGLAPINPEDGLPYELHHVGQKNDAPLAELTHSEHMSPENNKTLHPIRSGSEVDHGYSWRDIREDHWKARAEQFKQQNYGV